MLRNRVETIKGYTPTHAMDGSGIYLIRQMMTVARDRPAWEQRVESQLDLPPGSFTNLRRHWTKGTRVGGYQRNSLGGLEFSG
jgi:hypothetical protein